LTRIKRAQQMAEAELARRDKLTPAQRQILDRQDRYSRKARRRNIASGMRGFVRNSGRCFKPTSAASS